MGKHPKYVVDWDRWEDSDGEEAPDPNKAHWNASMHHAMTGGPKGGIVVEEMAKQPMFKDRFRTATIGGLGGGGPPTTEGMTTTEHYPKNEVPEAYPVEGEEEKQAEPVEEAKAEEPAAEEKQE